MAGAAVGAPRLALSAAATARTFHLLPGGADKRDGTSWADGAACRYRRPDPDWTGNNNDMDSAAFPGKGWRFNPDGNPTR